MSFNSWTSIHFSLFVGFRFFSLYFVFLLYRFRRFFPLEFVFLLYRFRFRFISLDFVFLLYRFRFISLDFVSYFTDFVSFRWISFSYFTDFVGFYFRFSVYRYPILNGSVHVFLNLEKKHNKPSLKIDPGTQKKPGNVKCNKTITPFHCVQYDVLWSTEKQYWPRPLALVNIAFQCWVDIAFQCSIAHHIALNEVQ